MKNDLKPCPFCEISQVSIQEEIDSPGYDGNKHYWTVRCGACGSSTGLCKTEDAARSSWNTRPHENSAWEDSSSKFLNSEDGKAYLKYVDDFLNDIQTKSRREKRKTL